MDDSTVEWPAQEVADELVAQAIQAADVLGVSRTNMAFALMIAASYLAKNHVNADEWAAALHQCAMLLQTKIEDERKH